MSRFLVALGLVLVALGLAWPYLRRAGLGRLPGDIVVKGDHTSFYFPIVTCLIISVVLTVIFWLMGR